MFKELFEISHSLPDCSSIETKYSVHPIEKSKHYFGKDNNNNLCLLLYSKPVPSDKIIQQSNIELESIEVQFYIPCKIADTTTNLTDNLSVLTCTSTDSKIQICFIYICELLLKLIGESPTLDQLVLSVNRLIELFRCIENPPEKSIQGLFGELLYISSSASPITAVQAWRNTVDARFDFAFDDVRIEIKTNRGHQRIHTFTLEQCCPPSNTTGILISLFTEQTGDRLSILDLVDKITDRLEHDTDLISKLRETVLRTLGSNFSSIMDIKFDEELSLSSMQIYDLKEIPAIRENVPVEVTNVHFRSNLNNTSSLERKSLEDASEILSQLLPNF